MKKKALILTILLYVVCVVLSVGLFYVGFAAALGYKINAYYAAATPQRQEQLLYFAVFFALIFPFILFPLVGILYFFFTRKSKMVRKARFIVLLVFLASSFLPLGFNTALQEWGKYQEQKHDGLNVRYYTGTRQVMMEENYKNGHQDGEQRYYYKNGQLEEIRTYKNGKLNGPRMTYYENGQLRTIEELKNDRSTGTDYSYYESGKTECVGVNRDVGGRIESTCYYENGKLKERVTFDEHDYVVILEKYNPDGSVVAPTPTPTPTRAPGQLP